MTTRDFFMNLELEQNDNSTWQTFLVEPQETKILRIISLAHYTKIKEINRRYFELCQDEVKGAEKMRQFLEN